MLNLTQSFIRNNRTFSNPQRITVRGLMLHSVGTAQPNAGVFVGRWNTATASTSVHGIIETEGRAFQLLPWTNRAWHAGGAANSTHIGIEMTEPANIRYTGSGANFVDNNPTATRTFVHDTYQTAVALFARLCGEFRLNPLADGVIISHSEGYRRGVASNHADVEHLWSRHGLSMAQFRRDVAAVAGGGGQMGSEPGEEIPATLFRVATQSSPLNCRVSPGPTAPILGTFARGALVTANRRFGDWLYVTDGRLTGWSSAAFLTEAVPIAVEALVRAGLINSPAYWMSRHREVPQLDRLLVSLSELSFGGRPVDTVETAIGILHRAGAIDEPEHWRIHHADLEFVDQLLKRAAGVL